jgi:hypothetical protein
MFMEIRSGPVRQCPIDAGPATNPQHDQQVRRPTYRIASEQGRLSAIESDYMRMIFNYKSFLRARSKYLSSPSALYQNPLLSGGQIASRAR